MDCKPGEPGCPPGDDKKQDYKDGKIGFDDLVKDYPIHSDDRKDLYDEFNKKYDDTIDGYDKDGNPIDKKVGGNNKGIKGDLMRRELKDLKKSDMKRGGVLKRFRKKFKHKYEDYRPGKQTYTDKHGDFWGEEKGEGPMRGVHKTKQRGRNVIVQKKKTKGIKRFAGLSSVLKKMESGPAKSTKVKFTKRGTKVVEREGLKRKVTRTKYKKAKSFTDIDKMSKSESSM